MGSGKNWDEEFCNCFQLADHCAQTVAQCFSIFVPLCLKLKLAIFDDITHGIKGVPLWIEITLATLASSQVEKEARNSNCKCLLIWTVFCVLYWKLYKQQTKFFSLNSSNSLPQKWQEIEWKESNWPNLQATAAFPKIPTDMFSCPKWAFFSSKTKGINFPVLRRKVGGDISWRKLFLFATSTS